MPHSDADIAAALAPAGLRFLGREAGDVPLPTRPGRSAASSRTEDGRIDAEPDEVVGVDDPELATKLNAAWLRLAQQHGLFNERREFLLAIDCSTGDELQPAPAWVRVQLKGEWTSRGAEWNSCGVRSQGCSPRDSCLSSLRSRWTDACC
ncbi:hypothetical protein [Actinomadura sp. NPDC049753]|uniref:hypothetical protein n=1 Tax=Actinomadura sp. NPDC049753 TaxID=3154739 RepID=UPI00342EC479